VEHVEAGLVGCEPGPFDLHAAERPHGDVAIRLPAPGASPVLQLDHLGDRFFDEHLDGILIGHPIAAGDGVYGVVIEAVIGLDHGCGAPLGRDRVAAHRIDFGDDPHVQSRVFFADGYCGTQSRASATDDKYIVA
jgi:hypothetical protein